MEEIECEWYTFTGIVCDKPATYTYRYDDIVSHLCKQHYKDIVDEEDE